MTTENDQQLKSDHLLRDLVAQLEGNENRIKVERDKFNEAVADYNTSVRKFPATFWAGIFDFERKGQFEADQAAQNAPKVDFNSGK